MLSPLSRKQHRFKKKIIQIIILVYCLWSMVSLTYAQPSRQIRVAIIQDAANFNLKINGFYEILDSANQKILSRGKNIRTRVTTYKGGISVGDEDFEKVRIRIKASGLEAIVINDRRYRGDIEVIKKDNSNLCVVNHIDLEDYIKGILYHEVSHYWPFEALKAQAVVCRTYALYQMQVNTLKDYDVTSDIYSQVYGGRISERYRTNKSVDKTKSVVLIYQNKVFPSFFHATCAGHTEDASLLWNIDMLPLKGVPCSFCRESPHFKWHSVLSLSKIEEKLSALGYTECRNIKDIVVLDRDGSGRITNLSITTDKKDIAFLAKDLRNALGPNIIRSTNFQVSIANQDAVFDGFGWGHGVGLCQWGAYFMARRGYKYGEILRYYYPGAKIALSVKR